MSSVTWNRSPSRVPKAPSADTRAASPPPRIPPIRAQEAIRAAVFRCWISSTSGGGETPGEASMSSCWPPTMPPAPAARARSAMARTARAGRADARGDSAITRNASVSNPSPARMAVASPYALWQVGFPRRKASSSIAGRSSWIREYVWTYSTAHANGSRSPSLPPTAFPAARRRTGRTRFPPAVREYAIASRSGEGARHASGARCAARLPSTSPRSLASVAAAVNALSLFLPEKVALLLRLPGDPPGLAQQQLDLPVRLGEPHPLLEEPDRLLQRRISGLEPRHHGLQTFQRLLEGRFLPFPRH